MVKRLETVQQPESYMWNAVKSLKVYIIQCLKQKDNFAAKLDVGATTVSTDRQEVQ